MRRSGSGPTIYDGETMSSAQRLADAVAAAKRAGTLRENTNPLDAHHFAIHWLLGELDEMQERITRLEQKKVKK